MTQIFSLSLIFLCVCVSLRLVHLSLVVQLSLLCPFQIPSREAQLDIVIPIRRFMQDQLRDLWPVYGLTALGSGSNIWPSQSSVYGSLRTRDCGVMCLVGIPVVGLSRTIMRTKNHLRNIPKNKSYVSCKY